MDNILVSIIVPAYNIESYIGRCLDSILNQSHEKIEILVIDDGSTDGTWNVIKQFAAKDQRIVAMHKENGGVSSTRRVGLEHAKGEYIGFVDGDDYVEPEMFERLLTNAVGYKAQISHCGYQMVFPDHVDYYYNTGRLVRQDKMTGLKDLILGAFVEPGLWNKLFHKTLIDSLLQSGFIDTNIKINEDLLMNYRLFSMAESAIYEDFCPYHYILRKGSAATSKISEHKLWDPLSVTKMILEDCPDDVKPVAFQRLIRQLINGATMNIADNPSLIKPFRVYTRKELRANLKTILFGSSCSIKLKIMALWVAVWPASYSWMHYLYAKITGVDKIYDIE